VFADVPERLDLEQARDQQVTLDVVFVVVVDPRTREQRLGLECQERGGHDEELGRHLEVGMLHGFEMLQVVLGQARDRHITDVDTVLADQREQELEGPLEDVQTDLIRRHAQRIGRVSLDGQDSEDEPLDEADNREQRG
jgi:hypothetical protein